MRGHLDGVGGGHAEAHADAALGEPLSAHLVDHGMLLGAIGRRAIKARHLGGVVAQRVDAARKEALLAVHIAPIDAAMVDEDIELGCAELGPLLLNLGDDALPRDAEVPARAQDAGALGAQAGRKLGTRPGVELGFDQSQGVVEGAPGN